MTSKEINSVIYDAYPMLSNIDTMVKELCQANSNVHFNFTYYAHDNCWVLRASKYGDEHILVCEEYLNDAFARIEFYHSIFA